MLVWSHYFQKLPIIGKVYKNNYVTLKRSYINFLKKSGIRPGPLVVHWLTTYRCNSNCVYCEASANEPKCEELKTEQIKKVLHELGELKVRRFFVTGGEPLMREDLFEVLDYAKQQGMSLGMITNSLLYAKFKKQIKNAEFKSIWTSVDGLASTHDKNRGHQNAYKIEDGVIIRDEDKCIGCRLCAVLCPYNAVTTLDDEIIKCDLCDGDPKCVNIVQRELFNTLMKQRS